MDMTCSWSLGQFMAVCSQSDPGPTTHPQPICGILALYIQLFRGRDGLGGNQAEMKPEMRKKIVWEGHADEAKNKEGIVQSGQRGSTLEIPALLLDLPQSLGPSPGSQAWS